MSDFYKTARIIRDATGDQRLSEVVKHLSSGWFPASNSAINEAVAEISRGKTLSSLLPVLKKDLGLLSYCIKRSRDLVDPTNSSSRANPIDVIKSASPESLLSIINTPAALISKHLPQRSSAHSISFIKQSVIGCSTTEALAEKIDTDPDTAFECALLRTLVPTLVSFNYPHLCASAVRRVRISKGDLDAEMAKLIGISPSRVLMSMSRQWGLSPALQSTLLYEAGNPRSQSPIIDPKLAKALVLGESYAQATDPRLFPLSNKKWEETKKEIHHYLGDKQLESITEMAIEYTRPFQEFLPDAKAKSAALHETSWDTGPAYSDALDKLLCRCSMEVQQAFSEVRKLITGEGLSLAGLRTLCNEALPAMKFSGGYFFLLNPTALRLEPILKIGEVLLPRLAIPYSPADPIAASLFSSAPIRQEFVGSSGASVPFFVGSMDCAEKTGVLYLELQRDARAEASYDRFLEFRAFQLCFHKCIASGLRG